MATTAFGPRRFRRRNVVTGSSVLAKAVQHTGLMSDARGWRIRRRRVDVRYSHECQAVLPLETLRASMILIRRLAKEIISAASDGSLSTT